MVDEWRTSSWTRVLAALCPVPVLGWLLVDTVRGDAPIPLLLAGVVLAELLVWMFAFRPRILLRDAALILRNPIRAKRISLLDVEDAQAGYGGLEFYDREGRCLGTAWAVQKSNLAAMAGRRVRADVVAEEIVRRATLERSPT